MFHHRTPLFHLISGIAITFTVAIAFAQEPNRQSENEPRQDLIKLNVIVTDNKGRPLKGMQKEDFRLKEEGKEQQITFFSEDSLPISYGVLIDATGSMRSRMEKTIEAVKAIVEKNRPGDETFFAKMYGQKTEILMDWTSDKQKLVTATRQPHHAIGNAPLIDGLLFCIDKVAQRHTGESSSKHRRAIVIITDGLEEYRKQALSQLVDKLRQHDIQIFVICFNVTSITSEVFKVDTQRKAAEKLNLITQETGGYACFPDVVTNELQQCVVGITEYLRSQYVIGYVPSLNRNNNSFRKVKITVSDSSDRQNRYAHTRSGYWAGSYKPERK